MSGMSFLPLLKGEAYQPRKHVFIERGPHGSAPVTANMTNSGYDLPALFEVIALSSFTTALPGFRMRQSTRRVVRLGNRYSRPMVMASCHRC